MSEDRIVLRATEQAEDKRSKRIIIILGSLAVIFLIAMGVWSHLNYEQASMNTTVAHQLADQLRSLGKQPVAQPVGGPAGTAGAAGAVGPTGATGATGKTGATGAMGTPGAPGATGAPGTAGAQGAMGSKGSTGSAGQDGQTGANGKDGAPGKDGSPGAQGVPGPQGSPGPAGATGPAGADGKDGSPAQTMTFTDITGTHECTRTGGPDTAPTYTCDMTPAAPTNGG